jgi:hypothetical protein
VNVKLSELSNSALWSRWKFALQDWAEDPRNLYRERKMNEFEDEIIKRLTSAGRHPALEKKQIAVENAAQSR